jgi:hypothetical protein
MQAMRTVGPPSVTHVLGLAPDSSNSKTRDFMFMRPFEISSNNSMSDAVHVYVVGAVTDMVLCR